MLFLWRRIALFAPKGRAQASISQRLVRALVQHLMRWIQLHRHLDGADVADVLDVAVSGGVQRHVLRPHGKALPVLRLVAVKTVPQKGFCGCDR